MSRREFPKAIKVAAFERAGGRCERCTAKITAANGPPEYDHTMPDYLGGEPTLENCTVLCRNCHGGKTSNDDRPRIDKTRRVYEKRIGARQKRSTLRKPSGYVYDWQRGGYRRSAD